ncbi:MAG TPA: phosphocholine cytidylyltransferase family protein [Lacipirellulaceae bacterium]|jgi:choline kinase|nr:phosphocholine cytidylyltransferase family protein [Lacipirellulaceae bacterium]
MTRVIVIAAGRGRRLMPTTENAPKCFAEVSGKRLIDWAVEAFAANGIDDVCFIGGYHIDVVKQAYPRFTFRHNPDWEHNNILASLFYAADLMDEPFVCCYSDVLFTPDIAGRLAKSPGDMVLGVDTSWLKRYEHRSEHPPDDAEKVTVANGHVTRVDRQIPEHDAYGEYIGVAKFSAAGAAKLREYYTRRRKEFAGQPWRGATSFEKAYKILLFQDMIDEGAQFSHVDTPGGYIEVDTQQDFDYARKNWATNHLRR